MSVFWLVLVGVLFVGAVFGARRERPHDGPGRRSDGHLNAGVVGGSSFGGFDGGGGAGGCDGGGGGTC